MGSPIDMVKLDGTWRLQYTSAPDVLVLFEAAARLPFFQVLRIETYVHFLYQSKQLSNLFGYISDPCVALMQSPFQ